MRLPRKTKKLFKKAINNKIVSDGYSVREITILKQAGFSVSIENQNEYLPWFGDKRELMNSTSIKWMKNDKN